MKNFLFLSITATLFLLHFEGERVVLFGVPIYFVEIGVTASAVALLFLQKKRCTQKSTAQQIEGSGQGEQLNIPSHPPGPIRWGIFFLLFGIASSTLAAFSSHSICPFPHEGLLRALGILKSWFLFPILFGWILFRVSDRHFSLEKLLFVFIVSFLPISILSSLMWLFGRGMTYDGRLEGIFNSPNALAMHLEPAIVLSWCFFRASKRSFLAAPLFALLSFPLLLTRSYSAWIAVFIALFFLEIARARNMQSQSKIARTKRKSVFLFLLFGTIVAFSQWGSPRFEHFFDPASRSSFASRLMIWKSAGKMIADSPLFGIGPGNFQSCYLSYQRYFPPYLEWSAPEPHNIFLAFWLESGIMGLLACCFLLFWWFRTVFQRTQEKKNLSVLAALMAIMIATLVHGLFDTTYWHLGLSYIFWTVFFLGLSTPCARLRFGEDAGAFYKFIRYIFPSRRL